MFKGVLAVFVLVSFSGVLRGEQQEAVPQTDHQSSSMEEVLHQFHEADRRRAARKESERSTAERYPCIGEECNRNNRRVGPRREVLDRIVADIVRRDGGNFPEQVKYEKLMDDLIRYGITFDEFQEIRQKAREQSVLLPLGAFRIISAKVYGDHLDNYMKNEYGSEFLKSVGHDIRNAIEKEDKEQARLIEAMAKTDDPEALKELNAQLLNSIEDKRNLVRVLEIKVREEANSLSHPQFRQRRPSFSQPQTQRIGNSRSGPPFLQSIPPQFSGQPPMYPPPPAPEQLPPDFGPAPGDLLNDPHSKVKEPSQLQESSQGERG